MKINWFSLSHTKNWVFNPFSGRVFGHIEQKCPFFKISQNQLILKKKTKFFWGNFFSPKIEPVCQISVTFETIFFKTAEIRFWLKSADFGKKWVKMTSKLHFHLLLSHSTKFHPLLLWFLKKTKNRRFLIWHLLLQPNEHSVLC